MYITEDSSAGADPYPTPTPEGSKRMTTDRTTRRTTGAASHLTPEKVRVIREVYSEHTTNGSTPATHPETGEPVTLGELKAYIGGHILPPVSLGSVHRIVTGQTHPDAPGETFPVKYRDEALASNEDTRTVAVTETYRVGKRRTFGKNGRGTSSKRDTAVLLSRRAVRGTGEKGHIVSITRLVEVTRDGVVVNPGRPLIVEGTTIEGNRELKPGRVLDAMCDPELVLDGQPNGLKDEQ